MSLLGEGEIMAFPTPVGQLLNCRVLQKCTYKEVA